MKNKEIAKIFFRIASYLEMDNIPFKPYAYTKAALALDELEDDVENIYKKDGLKGLEKINGVGKNIARHIEEYLLTGKSKIYNDYKKQLPIDLDGITAVEGLGIKRAKVLYEKLGIKNLKQLEAAAKKHKISPLFGFDEKTEQNILQGIEFVKKSKGRLLLAETFSEVEKIIDRLKKLKEVELISPAGSFRRKKETVGDVDILISAKSKNVTKIMKFFTSMKEVAKVWGRGSTKSSVRFGDQFDVDLRVVKRESFGAALQYFTGSKDHNIALRKIAIGKGLKLNEYGLFKGNKKVAGSKEEEVYKALGLEWIPPELREDNGEIEASLKKKLPKLIELKDVKGDLHCHSFNGKGIEILANGAIEKGYKYLGISDHTKFLRIENGLDEKQLALQRKKIDKLNAEFAKKKIDFKLLQGAELNILKDGSLDIKDSALAKLDYAIAGVHSALRMDKEQMTNRIVKAMKNPYVKIISHPTGRLLQAREEYGVDFETILKTAKEQKVVLEINASPFRLDLHDKNIKLAKQSGVKMTINSDAHKPEQLDLMEFGIYQARRGWATAEDIINTQSLDKIMKFLRKKTNTAKAVA